MSKIVKTVSVDKESKSAATKKAQKGKVEFADFWEMKNIIMLIVGLVSLIIGFYLMSVPPWDSNAALNYSPIFLLAAYLIFFPASILIRKKK
jgi:uncharacterized membrane protein HdeD (DUF308 family)